MPGGKQQPRKKLIFPIAEGPPFRSAFIFSKSRLMPPWKRFLDTCANGPSGLKNLANLIARFFVRTTHRVLPLLKTTCYPCRVHCMIVCTSSFVSVAPLFLSSDSRSRGGSARSVPYQFSRNLFSALIRANYIALQQYGQAELQLRSKNRAIRCRPEFVHVTRATLAGFR
jgi:hypothetical protein